jgi:hypothetical protein
LAIALPQFGLLDDGKNNIILQIHGQQVLDQNEMYGV